MRYVIGLLLVLHGIAHSVGFIGAWELAPEKVPYTPVGILAPMGRMGMRVFGGMWAIAAIAFVIVGYGAFRDLSWWRPATIIAAAISLVMCLLALPGARFGVLVDIVILASLIGLS
jgi:hypothetical protein